MNDELNIDEIPLMENEPEDGTVVAFTNYVRKDLLRRISGKLYGNWQPSFAGACVHLNNSFIYENSVIRKQKVGKCARTNKEIWMFEHH